MAPNLTEDEIDDLIYFARTGEDKDLSETLKELAEREKVTEAEILMAARDEGKGTCLHMATGNGRLDTVKLLLSYFAPRPEEEKKAYVDATNEFGNTALHWAALGGHLGAVRELVEEHGAAQAVMNDQNYVALDLANFNDHQEVAAYFLRKAGMLEGENGTEGGGLEAAAEGIELDGEGEEEGKESGGEGSSGKTA